MGADIHTYAERLVGDTWLPVRKYSKWIAEMKVKDKGDYWDKYPVFSYSAWYDGRNYELFGILAGVRRSWPDGSMPTFGEPRGLPADVSGYVQKESDSWGIDAHSHSYLTLKELLEYPWDKGSTPVSGLVSKEDARAYKEEGKIPSTWWQGSSNSEDVYLKWTVATSEMCGQFYKGTIPALKRLGDPSKVRIVFWFDN